MHPAIQGEAMSAATGEFAIKQADATVPSSKLDDSNQVREGSISLNSMKSAACPVSERFQTVLFSGTRPRLL
jgi:hypothetical protein